MNQLRYLYNEEELPEIDRYYHQVQKALAYQADSLRTIIDQVGVGNQIKIQLINGICKPLEGLVITEKSLAMIQNENIKPVYFLNFGISFAIVVTNDYFTFLVENYTDQRIDIVTPLKNDIENYPISKDESLQIILNQVHPQYFELREQILSEMCIQRNLTYAEKVQMIFQAQSLLLNQDKFMEIRQLLLQKYFDYYGKWYQGLVEGVLRGTYKLIIKQCQNQQQIQDAEKYRFHSYNQISDNINFERMERIFDQGLYRKKQFKQIKSIDELKSYGYFTHQDNFLMIITEQKKQVSLYLFNYLSTYQEVDKFVEATYQKYRNRKVEYIRIHPAFLRPPKLDLLNQIIDFIIERPDIFSNQRQNGKFIYEVFTRDHINIFQQYFDIQYTNNLKILNEIQNFVTKHNNVNKMLSLSEQIDILYSVEFIKQIDTQLSQSDTIKQDFEITQIKLQDLHQSKLSSYNIVVNDLSEVHSIIIVFSSEIGQQYNKISIGKKIDVELTNLRQCQVVFKRLKVEVGEFYLKKICSLGRSELVKGFLERKPQTIHQILNFIQDELDNKPLESHYNRFNNEQYQSPQVMFNFHHMIRRQ